MEKYIKTIGVYCGTFDPFHQGHQNILEKAERIFGKDNVIIAVGINPDKVDNSTLEVIRNYDKDSKDEVFDRIKQAKINGIKNQIPSKSVEGYIGFLTEYVREKEAEGYNVVVIRGLRNGYDYDYEYNQTRHMWDQFPGMNIIMIPCDPIYTHISSSAYIALEKVKPGSGHKYLAREIEDTSKVTTKMVEEQLSAVIILDKETDVILDKYKIVPLDSAKDYNFKGTYAQCLSWIKKKENDKE